MEIKYTIMYEKNIDIKLLFIMYILILYTLDLNLSAINDAIMK